MCVCVCVCLCVCVCVCVLQYNEGRAADDFVLFLNKNCGTFRMVGGKLSPLVSGGGGGVTLHGWVHV